MKNNYHRRLVAEREWAFNLINKGYDTKQKLSEGIEEGRNFEIDKLIKHFNYVSFERLIEKAKDFKGQEIKYGMVGNSESFKEVTSMMSKILDKDCVVLITGETGTGKNMIAEGIHFHG
ncbi:MAG: sigma 54-interacting transcriptional regulator, partial [Candidatus Aenigmarchaeota archaeon]|nr:sigma 54-interacting transcriptional regulator [Candidatus Aenigmarchaeota archaeon]